MCIYLCLFYRRKIKGLEKLQAWLRGRILTQQGIEKPHHRELQIPAKPRVIFYKTGQSLEYFVDDGEEGREAIQEAVLVIRNGVN